MPVGRTSPSTRLGATIERPADVPLVDSDRDVTPQRSGWLSSRSTDDSVNSSPVQADGPGSGLVPRTDRHSLLLLLTTATSLSADVPWLPVSSSGPTQHPAFSSNSEMELQFPAYSGGGTHDAKLHFANQSHSDFALSLSAHTVKPYLNSASLSSTFHTATAHCKIHAFSSTVYTHLSSLAKFLHKPTKKCASYVSTLSPDLTDSHKLDLSGRARTQAVTAYTWRQKINTSLWADLLTTATPQVKVHANTWRSVLTIAASPYHATGGRQNNKTI